MLKLKVLIISTLGALLILSFILFSIAQYNSSLEKLDTNRADSDLQSGAKNALIFIDLVRSYPDEQIPKSGISQAHFMAKELGKHKKSNTLNWEALGPRNIGGRTLALAINPSNPDIIYAGSASGGLWKSATGGSGLNAWEYVRTGYPVLGVGAIAIDPNDTNTMYIGTGENYGSLESFPGIGYRRTTRGSYGIGILKSKDGGLTWGKSLDWSLDQRTAVQKIQVNPIRSNSVWAATTEGLYRSYDGGETWENVHKIVMATDIIINPIDTSIVYVAHGGMGSLGHGLYRSINGGESFEKMNLNSNGDGPTSFSGKMVLSISESEPNILMASIGNSDGSIWNLDRNDTWLMRTIDGGDTWSLASDLDYSAIQGWYAHSVAIDPTNSDKIWTAGQPMSIFTSETGGTELEKHTIVNENPLSPNEQDDVYPNLIVWADFHDIIYHPTDPEIIYFINDGGIFRTTNGGDTFENCNSGYQTTQFYNGVSNSNTNGDLFIGGLQDNHSVIYEGNAKWRRASAGDGGWTAIDQTNNNNIVLSYQFGEAAFSDDLFTENVNYFHPPFFQFSYKKTNFITPMILSPADNKTFYSAGEEIWTTNLGINDWQRVENTDFFDGNAMSVMAGSYQDANVLYVGSMPKDVNSPRSHLYRTDDKGQKWYDITDGLPNRIFTDLVVDPTNDRRVIISLGGFGDSHLLLSENGGEDWNVISDGLPDIPIWSVAIDPKYPNHIYVGNEVGVFYSNDSGETWDNISGNLPDAVFAMDLVISQSNRKLRLATHGNGAYQTDLMIMSSINEDISEPERIRLYQNYPNPFNPSTTITYELTKISNITLEVFDVSGKKIVTLINETKGIGIHNVQFNASELSNGVYIYRLNVDGEIFSKKMTLIK